MIKVIFKAKNRLYQFTLSQADDFLFELDKILKKNKIGIADLKYFKLVFSKDAGFLSRRIIKAFNLAFKLSQKTNYPLIKQKRKRAIKSGGI